MAKQVQKGVNDLETLYPELAKEWHPTKNGTLLPCNVSKASHKKVWWLGKCGHEWQAWIADRTHNESGCPICAGKKVLIGFNDLESQDLTVASEWDYDKNSDLLPSMVTTSSNKKVWWKCKKGHEWQATISARHSKHGCPVCAGRKVIKGFNDLETQEPLIAAEWNYNKNGDLLPSMVTTSSNKKIWWKCKKGHEWQATINARHSGCGCPFCSGRRVLVGFNDLESQNPVIAAEWNYNKNGDLLPSMVTKGSQKKVWWKCRKGHEWQAKISNRTILGRGCPECAKWMRTSFQEQAIFFYISKYFPDAVNGERTRLKGKELDIFIPSKNVAIEFDGFEWHKGKSNYMKESQKNLLCQKFGITLIRLREEGLDPHDNCICINNLSITKREKGLSIAIKEILNVLEINDTDVNINRDRSQIYEQSCSADKERSLAVVNPNLAAEWHPTKNGKLLPTMVSAHANQKVWWLGKCGHEWQAWINNRINGIGCPICGRNRVYEGKNDLKTTRPDLANEWHPTKNGELQIEQITCWSEQKVWWKCKKCGHDWEASPRNRTEGSSCPFCKSIQNLRPDLAKEWHPTKNGALLPSMVTAASCKKVWWKCSTCSFEWESTVGNRAVLNRGCPECAKKRVAQSKQKRVLNLDTSEMFDSVKEAASKYNMSPSSIAQCCRKAKKTAGGYHWQYVEKKESSK